MRSTSRRSAPLRATDLAKLGYCEQKAVYEHQFGERLTWAQRLRIRRGNAAHERFHREAFAVDRGVRTSIAKPWCFIATAVFEPQAPQLAQLRRFRDTVLRPTPIGRCLIGTYYRHSLVIAATLQRHPAARATARALLAALCRALGRWER